MIVGALAPAAGERPVFAADVRVDVSSSQPETGLARRRPRFAGSRVYSPIVVVVADARDRPVAIARPPGSPSAPFAAGVVANSKTVS